MRKNTVINCSLLTRNFGRILIVDDEEDIALVLKKGLERYGFRVDAFNEPELALAGFKEGSYDLIITDVNMPGMSGFDLYRKIRKTDARVKVCFMSAFEVYPKDLEKASPEEVKCFIKKPVSIGSLIEIVRGELDG